MKADKADIKHKLKVARGQLDGILRMIDEDRYCVDISCQILATQALLKNANQAILRAHIRNCVREALQIEGENPKLEEALQLLEKMMQ
jgi:DNA-binding FrmR family transcriptional regulator